MNILLTNDDGIDAPGLVALETHLAARHAVATVAPRFHVSGSGHSISLSKPMRVERRKRGSVELCSIEGTPADCVKFALFGLGLKPDVVLSGFNLGANTGVSVHYSGTVSAAREALIAGTPAIALSVASREVHDFAGPCRVVDVLLAHEALWRDPLATMLNVNIPPVALGEIKGIRVTQQARSRFAENFQWQGSGEDETVLLTGEILLIEDNAHADEEAVRSGYVSVTPLGLDLTDYKRWESLKAREGDLDSRDWQGRKPSG